MPLNPEQFTACHRKWSELTPTERGRLCTECDQEIIDFRSQPDHAIEAVHAARSGVCGVYSISQFRSAPRLAAASIAAGLVFGGIPAMLEAETPSVGTGVAQPESLREATLVVRGTVMHSVTGRPLAGAQVHVVSTRFGAITNDDGAFSFTVTHALTAPVRVSALRIGYRTVTFETQTTEGEASFDFRMTEAVLEVVGIIVTGTRPAEQTPQALAPVRKPSLLRRLWNWITH